MPSYSKTYCSKYEAPELPSLYLTHPFILFFEYSLEGLASPLLAPRAPEALSAGPHRFEVTMGWCPFFSIWFMKQIFLSRKATRRLKSLFFSLSNTNFFWAHIDHEGRNQISPRRPDKAAVSGGIRGNPKAGLIICFSDLNLQLLLSSPCRL